MVGKRCTITPASALNTATLSLAGEVASPTNEKGDTHLPLDQQSVCTSERHRPNEVASAKLVMGVVASAKLVLRVVANAKLVMGVKTAPSR